MRGGKAEENEPTICACFYRCDVSIRANFHSHQVIIPNKLSAVYVDCVGNNLIDPNKGRLFGALDFRFLLCSTSVLFESQSGVRIDPKFLVVSCEKVGLVLNILG